MHMTQKDLQNIRERQHYIVKGDPLVENTAERISDALRTIAEATVRLPSCRCSRAIATWLSNSNANNRAVNGTT